MLAVPTGATLVSFALSNSVLYFGPRLAHEAHASWVGIFLVAVYLITLLLGALLGGLGAFLIVLKLQQRSAPEFRAR